MSVATEHSSNDTLLKRVFYVNALATGLMGAGFAAGAGSISARIGLANSGIVFTIGIGLILFAGLLYRNAISGGFRRLEALAIVLGDFAWVIASGIVILLGILNTTGNWAVALVANVVLLFAILEWIGIRRAMRH